MELDFADKPRDVVVALFEGAASHAKDTGNSDFVATLASPATLAAGTNTFTAPANTVLKRTTFYHVVVSGEAGNLHLKGVSDVDNDAPPNWTFFAGPTGQNRETGAR